MTLRKSWGVYKVIKHKEQQTQDTKSEAKQGKGLKHKRFIGNHLFNSSHGLIAREEAADTTLQTGTT